MCACRVKEIPNHNSPGHKVIMVKIILKCVKGVSIKIHLNGGLDKDRNTLTKGAPHPGGDSHEREGVIVKILKSPLKGTAIEPGRCGPHSFLSLRDTSSKNKSLTLTNI